MDEILLKFIQENFVTIGLALACLKVIAKATPWALDDQILQIVSGFISRKENQKS